MGTLQQQNEESRLETSIKLETALGDIEKLDSQNNLLQSELEQKSAALENMLTVSKIKDENIEEMKEAKSALETDNADLKLAIQSLSNQVNKEKNDSMLEEVKKANEELQSKLETGIKKSKDIHEQLA